MTFNNLSVLLANGEYPKHEYPLEILKESKNIICLDGAVNNLVEINLNPTFSAALIKLLFVKYWIC